MIGTMEKLHCSYSDEKIGRRPKAMNLRTQMVILKGEIHEDDVRFVQYNKLKQTWDVTFTTGKTYSYAYDNVKFLKDPQPVPLNGDQYTTAQGVALSNVTEILEFTGDGQSYLRFFFDDGKHHSYPKNSLTVSRNALHEKKASDLFDYFRKAAHQNSLCDDNGNSILGGIYDRMQYVSADSILADYLNHKNADQPMQSPAPIFPFGCNVSQITAVRNAMQHRISIIEGPPGTGKTQTILNIIANIVLNGQTVMVVSNNNSATDNVFEKLQKYGYDYIAAQLGSSQKKAQFIAEKQTEYPDFGGYPTLRNVHEKTTRIQESTQQIRTLLQDHNRLAELKSQLSALELEQQYYLEYYHANFEERNSFGVYHQRAEKLLLFLAELQAMLERRKTPNFWKRLGFWFRFHLRDMRQLKANPEELIAEIQKLYYEKRCEELRVQIHSIEESLHKHDADAMTSKLLQTSEELFRYRLKQKYAANGQRCHFDEEYWKNPKAFLDEYPVLLSTTFSSSGCFKGMLYDYVIVDEASQVDLACGVLAMSCAKRLVVVGDLKQLPNVVTDEDRQKLTPLAETSAIPGAYRCEKQSLLSSVCEVFSQAPWTLLREHYRCHPKIIGFCNQKFYDGKLLVMTENHGEPDVMKVHITVKGSHARGHYNQRQINEIKQVILPELDSEDVGIIAPYREQTKALTKEITDEIPISTVHKFQGRENDDIIISTVDNEISEFADDPNLLNVAVSRAKKRLRIVVSDHENNRNTNIGELVRYIQYNNFDVAQSRLYSIFDMLYQEYEEKRKQYLAKHKRISEYDSENLMYALLESLLTEEAFQKLEVAVHFPLYLLIRDKSLLAQEECAYAMHPNTHLDFVIFHKIDKEFLLAVEVDGHEFHKEGTRQHERDTMKDQILEKYGMPLLRFSTTGCDEETILREKLEDLLQPSPDRTNIA